MLCTRCVRVCDEIEGAHTWDVMGRGVESRVIIDLEPALGRFRHLHQLRQMRRGLPHRRLTRKGTGVAEMEKDDEFLPYLTQMRGRQS